MRLFRSQSPAIAMRAEDRAKPGISLPRAGSTGQYTARKGRHYSSGDLFVG